MRAIKSFFKNLARYYFTASEAFVLCHGFILFFGYLSYLVFSAYAWPANCAPHFSQCQIPAARRLAPAFLQWGQICFFLCKDSTALNLFRKYVP